MSFSLPPLKGYATSLKWTVLALIFFHGLVIFLTNSYVMDLKQPQHDELHFIKTIHLFDENMSLNSLKHYEEMSTPLPFMLYALWGHVLGFEFYKLRGLSIIIAMLTYLLFHRFLFTIFANGRVAFYVTMYLAIIPYMAALSFLVYTDMLAMFFLILSCFAIVRQNPFAFAVSAACALLCRQYLSFILLAGAVFYLIKYIESRERIDLQMLASIIISFLPFLCLVFLWQGLVPENSMQNKYLGERTTFHMNFLVFYICLFSIYLFPIVVLTCKSYYKNIKVLVACFVISWSYWLFPVTAAKSMIESGVDTAGFFHTSVKRLFENDIMEHVVFYIAFLCGLPVVLFILRDIYEKWQIKDFAFSFFLDISIIAFLLVMPFSYLVWEKYFMLIIPLAAVRLLLPKYDMNKTILQ